mgnify:CR=1 FL=1
MNNPSNSPGNQGSPMPFMFPIMVNANQERGHGLQTNEVPARVQVALTYLKHLTIKTMTQVVANDVGFETVDGQELTKGESAAQDSAANLLRDYFAGAYLPDSCEERNGEVERRVAAVLGQRGLSTPCYHCRGERSVMVQCPVCRGTGRVLVFPDA